MTQEAASIRRFAGWALVGGLSLAAATAVFALLSGSLDDTDGRVILTSIGFALASATAASGASARLRPSSGLWILGTFTLLASAVAFVLLLAGLWTNTDEWGSEGVWRAFGCAAVCGLAGSHACLMLGARRCSDSEAVRVLTFASLLFALLDAVGAILPISDLVSDIDEGWTQVFGAALVMLVLTSVLPPILRRVQPALASPDSFASQVAEIADRIDSLNSDPGNRAPEIRAEARRLRKLAKSAEK